MTIGILLVSHAPLGQTLLDTAIKNLGIICPLATTVLDVPFDADPRAQVRQAETLYTHLDTGDGVLVLTDLCGATPSNIASHLAQQPRTMVIAGLNLPMLIRVLNYSKLELTELAEHAAESGRRDILSSPGNCG
jgi:PTS system ascorbate-specific IIA component